ncbi:MAG: elongation factor Ts [Bacteroidales bacterium]|jgi:elongation factor Ts|nr:elongation factor Ts [Bacteroidales bacterium]
MANITAADVNKLRQETGIGMMDCKKALVEAEGDFEKARDILRKKGQKVAEKRADRASNEGRIIAKTNADRTKGYMLVMACETDFVGKGDEFVNFTDSVLDKAMAADINTKEDLLNMQVDGMTVADKLTEMTGKTGEKIECPDYQVLEAAYVEAYNHMGNHIATLVGFNKPGEKAAEAAHNVALHIAAMAPVALDETAIPQDVKDKELAIGVEKTRLEMVQRAVDSALHKAGINPAHVDSDDHINSNMAKGWITEEQAEQARKIKAEEAEKAAANLNEKQIQQIAQGRLVKFFKESTLKYQVLAMGGDGKENVGDYIKRMDKDLGCVSFIRRQIGG